MRSPRVQRPAAAPSGFTLVELIVAIIVLTIGILALASTAGVVARQMSGGAQQTLAAHVAQTRFERLRAVSCASLTVPGMGSDESRGIREVWTVANGNGSNPSVTTLVLTDTVRYRAGRRYVTRAFQSTRTCP